MKLTVLETASVASGACNEDRAGSAGVLGWVIDGATDVVDAPLTSDASDAAWFAEHLHRLLAEIAAPSDLARLPAVAAARLASMFSAAAARPPADRSEHPSAAAVVVRAGAHGLDYVSVGDCTIIAETVDGVQVIGMEPDTAGDKWLADAIAAFQARQAAASAEDARQHVWPRVRAARLLMNEPHGYGVFSITPTPPRFIRSGTLGLAAGARVLLATDGLMRLVDVYRVMRPAELFQAVVTRGLAALMTDLRAIETADATCRRYPRAKVSDDATGLLLRFL